MNLSFKKHLICTIELGGIFLFFYSTPALHSPGVWSTQNTKVDDAHHDKFKKKKWLCKALFVLLIWSITQWERHLYEYESGTLLCTHCNLVSISALAVPHWLDYTTTSPRAFLFFCTNLLQQPQPAHSECTPLSLYLLYTRSQDQCFFFLSHNSAAV